MPSPVDTVRLDEVRVLEADPELGARLDPAEAREARDRARARVEVVERGPWPAAERRRGETATLGLLVLDGLLTRTVAVADRRSTELLGAGDLLRPWQREDAESMLAARVEWHVLETARLAVLDDRFTASVADWPRLTEELVNRAMQRSRSLALRSALSHVTRVDRRLLLLFWHFAERWGRVRPDWVVVRLPLTHECLAALVGARRPSVSTALAALARRGLLERRARGEWLLRRAGPEQRDPVAARSDDLSGFRRSSMGAAATG